MVENKFSLVTITSVE